MGVVVFGADGGGTKTLGLIADQDGYVLAQQTGGATNANVVGVDAAVETLAALLEKCCTEAGCTPQDLQAVVLGLAGAGRRKLRNEITEQLRVRLGSTFPVFIETDARVALEGAFAGRAGIVIIAGTGSVVIGKSPSGAIELAGGWGRLLGDEGSGFAFGVEALKSVAALLDSRASGSILTTAIMEETGCRTRSEILDLIYEDGFDVSQLAPHVLHAAENDDATALGIVRTGAEALAAQAQVVAQRLHLREEVAVAFHGGLLQNNNVYARMLTNCLQERIPRVAVCPPAHSPAYGAVLMALNRL